MSEKVKGFIVTLSRDVNEEGLKHTMSLMREIKGVVSVKPVTTDAGEHINRERIKHDLRMKLLTSLDI